MYYLGILIKENHLYDKKNIQYLHSNSFYLIKKIYLCCMFHRLSIALNRRNGHHRRTQDKKREPMLHSFHQMDLHHCDHLFQI